MKIGKVTVPRSAICTSNENTIVVRGADLAQDLIGQINFGDYFFLLVTGRRADAATSAVLNATLVAIAEHGLVPSVQAARMTLAAAPDAMQGAVAAGLNGLGSVFVGSIEGAAKMLSESMPVPDAEADFAALAVTAVTSFRAQKRIVPGIGHPFHKPIDPRTPRLMELARETGFDGPYLKLIVAIAEEAAQRSGKLLPVNATGAIGALCCEMGFDWKICRGLGVMGRAVGLVGHILEESRNPMSEEIWHSIEARATAHMNPDAEPE